VGNEIRQYLEKVLKEICCKLRVKLPFKYNEKNECRKLQEFLDGLELKFGEEDLKKKKVLENIKNSIPLLHDLSHDTSGIPRGGDVETCFSHVKELEKVFLQETD
jgi:hypothetical protein